MKQERSLKKEDGKTCESMKIILFEKTFHQTLPSFKQTFL